MVKEKEYESGLKLIVKEIPELMSVSVGITVGVGSGNENEKTNGISHFIEHVNFKGTEKRTAFDISENADRIGAQLNAFTAKDCTCYYIKTTKDDLENAFEILSDIFVNSTYPEDELEKEKDVVIEEINMDEDTPEELVLDVVAKSHFGSENYGRSILGSKKNVKSFTKKDILEYKKEYYTANNIVISFAGNVSFSSADKLVEKYIEGKLYAKNDRVNKREIKVLYGDGFKKKDIEQTHICLAFNGLTYANEKMDCLNIVNTALGGGMSSRLFQNIRENKGLCYSVYTFPNAYRDAGSLIVYAGVNPEKADTAYEEIIKEIKNLKSNGITEDEFLRSKAQIKSAFIFGQESTVQQMTLFGKYLLFTGEVYDFEKKINAINSITLGEVNEFIGEMDIDNYSTAIIGKNVNKLR